MTPFSNLSLFRDPAQVRGWFARTFLYRGADRSLARLFADVPVPPGNPADAWIRDCLAWTWLNVVPRPREPGEGRPTVRDVLADMATFCEGYAVLLCAMGHAGLSSADQSRIRFMSGHMEGRLPHSWAQWTDSDGQVYMLDPAQSETPIAGTGGWTVDVERFEFTRPLV